MSDSSSLRVADSDREQIAAELREHLDAVEAHLSARRARALAHERHRSLHRGPRR